MTLWWLGERWWVAIMRLRLHWNLTNIAALKTFPCAGFRASSGAWATKDAAAQGRLGEYICGVGEALK